MSVAAVAHIAYISSDILVNSLPPLPATSPYAETYQSLAAKHTTSHSASLVNVPFGADPGSILLRYRTSRLLSYTSTSSSQVLSRLLLHLPELASSPLVLHIAVQDDLSDVLVLRSIIPFFLYSRNAQEAHDHALLAAKLARVEGKAVLHAFKQTSDIPESQAADDDMRTFIVAEKATAALGKANGHANGHENGSADGHANGDASPDVPSDDSLLAAYESASYATAAFLLRPLHSISQHGSVDSETLLVLVGDVPHPDAPGVSYLDLSLLKPLPSRALLDVVEGESHVVLVEQLRQWQTKWTPIYLELLGILQQSEASQQPTLHTAFLANASTVGPSDVLDLVRNASSSAPSKRLVLGQSASLQVAQAPGPHIPKHESAYVKLLNQIFGDRLEISNSPSLIPSEGAFVTSPEFALGRVRGQVDARADLEAAVSELLADAGISGELHSLLGRWLKAKDDWVKGPQLGDEIVSLLLSEQLLKGAASRILNLRSHFAVPSRWIIGSDAWSYDLGASGLHHAISSGLNVNVLVLDTIPYSSRDSVDPGRRKQDVGLYAMNYGDVYVASVAVYSSYSQVLQALIEANKFDGPSVVVAYLPYQAEDTPALEVLKETKLAVDAGYWPLYRWNPRKEREGKDPFVLDSDTVKNELQKFLDRQNHLSQLVSSRPQLATELVSNLGDTLKEARRRRARQAFDELLTAIDAPPLKVLFASDGGKAEKVARRLATRGRLRGLSTDVAPMDSVSLEDIAKEQFVVFVTSVAGQGEFPQNGRTLWKASATTVAKGEKPLSQVQFSVFGMGDSHYWPRPEDAHYYNKPGKDLNARLEQLGGQRVVDLGLGDDQDADGPETGYKVWEPLIWKALGVDAIELREAEPEPITNEHIKVASQYLRGTIKEGLEDTTTGALAPSDTQLTKFHGIYQQDDRDIRDERQAEGAELAYSFMIRVRMPGGVCTPAQWLLIDQIADEHGNGTFKITTRQTFQFHGVIKRHLKSAIQDINKALLDTLAACGDVNRNVIVSAIPTLSKTHNQAYDFAKRLSEHLLPRTTAYHEIWLDKKLIAGDAVHDVEPLYGEFYLPRKFKVAVAVPPINDVDVYANDLGFIVIVNETGDVVGFNVTAGGGMGVTHGNKKTYPRLGSMLGYCPIDRAIDIAEKIMLVQRDNGNREDRKNARLKYTIDRMGLDAFKAEVERRLGYSLQPPHSFTFDRNIDDFGWTTGEDGRHHFTCFIENGRIQDEPGLSFKTGLRELAKIHKGRFRMTANQHLVITDIATEDVPTIKTLLAKYKLDNVSHTGLRLSSSACVAFPTCGLAMAESERYLPLLIDKVEKICEKNGLRNDSIVMRMTGCPNGCARPYVAEVAFVGKAPGAYSMLLGGGYYGQRLNKIYRDSVSEPEILAILEPMIKHYALERQEGEHFGDFVIRAGYISATNEGKEWWDRAGGEGQWREA